MYSKAWNLTYRDVQALCRLAYTGRINHEKVSCYLSAENHAWQIRTVQEDSKSGFRAIAATGSDVNGRGVKVLAFAGSSDVMVSLTDWGMQGNLGNFAKGAACTTQYKQAAAFAQSNPADYFVGHSLGGGLALFCCLNFGVRTATINPSPIFDEYFGTQYAERRNTELAINYCTPSDMLRLGRGLAKNGVNVNVPLINRKVHLSPSLGATPGIQVEVGSVGEGGVQQHVMDYLVGFTEPRFHVFD